jgi:hypothetical protein
LACHCASAVDAALPSRFACVSVCRRATRLLAVLPFFHFALHSLRIQQCATAFSFSSIYLLLNPAAMGRNKFSEREIKEISKLLRMKNAANRAMQKQLRHTLRVDYEFNISDFNVQGQAFGEAELAAAIARGAITVLDEAMIEAMKAKRARDRARDALSAAEAAPAQPQTSDWQQALREWEEWEKTQGRDAD